jgi:methylmalonyl-CoA/ethylmalonyl-CoA epimerase
VFGLPFHHVGIACRDIDEAAAYYGSQYRVESDSGTVFDPLQNAQLRIFNVGTPGAIELVAGPVVEKLLRRDFTYYHICYTTPDLEATLERARTGGGRIASEPKAAVLFGGRRVAFVYTPFGLVEFLETGDDASAPACTACGRAAAPE